MNRFRILLPLLLLLALVGCGSESDRVADLAVRDAERQATQNEKLLDLENRIARGAQELVSADAASRESLADTQRILEEERQQLDHQKAELDSERRLIASQRRTDPIYAAGFEILAMLAAAAVPLGLCWLLLRQSSEPVDEVTAELLLDDLVADQPIVLVRPTDPNALLDSSNADRPRLSRTD